LGIRFEIPYKVFSDREISDAAKLLYGLLGHKVGNGFKPVKNSELALAMELSQRQVSRLLSELEPKYITIINRENGHRSLMVNI
jgi:hypothetical protein